MIGDLQKAWSRATSALPDEWSPDNPSRGQCAVTALIVQDIMGGDLLRVLAFNKESHYFNLVGGVELDLTREQFGRGYWHFSDSIQVRDREYVLSFPDTRMRYWLLRSLLYREAHS